MTITFDELDPGLLGGTSVLCILFGALAAGAGIGGGGLLVPLYAFVLGVGAKNAVPLSQATILGVAIGNCSILCYRRHPKAQRPIIDYDLATFMNSGLLLGTVFGVLFNNLLPDVAIIILLFLLLGYNSYRTFKKGFTLRAKETKAINDAEKAENDNKETKTEKNSAADPGTDSLEDIELSEANSDEEKKESKAEVVPVEDKIEEGTQNESKDNKPISPALQKYLEKESIQFPRLSWAILMSTCTFIIIYALTKAGIIGGMKSCWLGWWIWYIVPVPVFFTVMICYALFRLRPVYLEKEKLGYQYLEGDLKWDFNTMKKFPFISWLAGVAAGLLGIGGGMVVGPLMLELGILPQVGSAVNGFLILFTASSGSVQYLAAQRLEWKLFLWFASMGFCGGQLGQRVLGHVLKRSGRQSYVVFLLASIIGVSCCAMFISGVVKLAIDPDFSVDLKDLCRR